MGRGDRTSQAVLLLCGIGCCPLRSWAPRLPDTERPARVKSAKVQRYSRARNVSIPGPMKLPRPSTKTMSRFFFGSSFLLLPAEAGADPDIATERDVTALSLARAGNYEAIVQLLEAQK